MIYRDMFVSSLVSTRVSQAWDQTPVCKMYQDIISIFNGRSLSDGMNNIGCLCAGFDDLDMLGAAERRERPPGAVGLHRAGPAVARVRRGALVGGSRPGS